MKEPLKIAYWGLVAPDQKFRDNLVGLKAAELKSAIKLNEQALAQAGHEHQDKVEVLSVEQIDQMNLGQMDGYFRLDPNPAVGTAGTRAVEAVSHYVDKFSAARRVARSSILCLAATAGAIFAPQLQPVLGSLAGPVVLSTLGRLVLGGAAAYFGYRALTSPLPEGPPLTDEQRSLDEKTNQVKFQVARALMPDAAGSREALLEKRHSLESRLSQARLVDPSLTLPGLLSPSHDWILEASAGAKSPT